MGAAKGVGVGVLVPVVEGVAESVAAAEKDAEGVLDVDAPIVPEGEPEELTEGVLEPLGVMEAVGVPGGVGRLLYVAVGEEEGCVHSVPGAHGLLAQFSVKVIVYVHVVASAISAMYAACPGFVQLKVTMALRAWEPVGSVVVGHPPAVAPFTKIIWLKRVLLAQE